MGAIKKIYDAVHRFIHVDQLESDLINTRPFQRLHYIRQLGVTFFVYPGGNHCRFEHSLGVMELSTRIYDEVTMKDPPSNLSSDFQKILDETIPKVGSFDHRYWRRILRLASLCHDLGHLPFSHTAEKRLLGEGGHEIWTCKIINSPYLEPIWKTLQEECEKEKMNVRDDVLKIALGEKKYHQYYPGSAPFTPWEKIVTSILTGDFFGADRIDYLLRDSQYTGLAYGLFDYHQLIEMLKVIPSHENKNELSLGVEENGIESCEALLLARYYMHKRLYQYSSVKSYTFHMSRFMGIMYPEIAENLDAYIAMTDNEVLADLNKASEDPSHPGHLDAKSLYLRQNRFRAIPLSSPPDVSKLKEIQKKLSIQDEEISWEIWQKKMQKHQGFSFPVLMQDGSVEIGDKLSQISIPMSQRSWVFITPRYEKQIREHLSLIEEL